MQKWLGSLFVLALSEMSFGQDWEDFDLDDMGGGKRFSGLFQAQTMGIAYDEDDSALAKTQLRLEYTDSHGQLKWFAHAQLQAWQASNEAAGLYGPRGEVQARATPLTKSDDHPRNGAAMELDWLYLSGEFRRANYALGRQPITLSYGKVWSPSDIYAPFSYFDLDRLYKAGVDAMRINYYPSEKISAMSVLAALGEYGAEHEIGASQSINAAMGWGRWSVMLARTAYSDAIAVALQRNEIVFGIDAYIEGIVNELTPYESSIWQEDSVASAIVGFSRKITSNSIFTYEFLYQSTGENSTQYNQQLARHLISDLPELGFASRYHSVSLSSQITGLLVGEFLMIQNLEDSGVNISGLLKYSMSNNVEGRLGFSYSPHFNRNSSEYSLYPDVLQLGVNWFF